MQRNDAVGREKRGNRVDPRALLVPNHRGLHAQEVEPRGIRPGTARPIILLAFRDSVQARLRGNRAFLQSADLPKPTRRHPRDSLPELCSRREFHAVHGDHERGTEIVAFSGLTIVVSVGVSRGYRVLRVVAALRVPRVGVAGLGGIGAAAGAAGAPHRRYRLFSRHSRKRGDFRPGDVHGPHHAQRIPQLRGGSERRSGAAAVSAVRGKIGAIFVIPRFGPIFCSRTLRCITRFGWPIRAGNPGIP